MTPNSHSLANLFQAPGSTRTPSSAWWLLLVFLLLSITSLSSQPGRKFKSKQELTPLQQALNLRESQPEEAIKVLTSALRSKQNPDNLSAIFTLLGDIYVDIKQDELALNRYNQALALGSMPSPTAQADLYSKRGAAFLRLQQLADAENSFTSCLFLVDSTTTIGLACQEGLADIATAKNQFELSQQIYGNVQQNTSGDELQQSRVAAKRASNYVRIDDLPNAKVQYEEALKQLPAKEGLQEVEYKEVIAANLEINDAVNAVTPKAEGDIGPEIKPTGKALPTALVVSDALNRFERSRRNDEPQAEAYLEAALAAVDSNTSHEIASRLYQTGADFYLVRNQAAKATAIYRKYLAASEDLLREQREELRQQAAVLKEQSNVDLALKDEQLANRERSFMGRQIQLQRWLIIALGALLFGALFSVFLILRNVRKRRRANQELLLRSLQTQMNPHFIFNSLNSINNYIAKRDERSANRFLGRFAKLMRNVLDQSGKTFVPVAEEVEQLGLYLELEEQRFAGKFTYELTVDDPQRKADDLGIPPMLIQPFVENAIWHGLRYLPHAGRLKVHFAHGESGLTVTIEDNGIGRDKSADLKTDNQKKHRSTGLKNTAQRVELVNDLYQQEIDIDVVDAEPDAT